MSNKRSYVTVRLPPATVDKVEAEVKRLNIDRVPPKITRSSLIAAVVEKWLAAEGKS